MHHACTLDERIPKNFLGHRLGLNKTLYVLLRVAGPFFVPIERASLHPTFGLVLGIGNPLILELRTPTCVFIRVRSWKSKFCWAALAQERGHSDADGRR